MLLKGNFGEIYLNAPLLPVLPVLREIWREDARGIGKKDDSLLLGPYSSHLSTVLPTQKYVHVCGFSSLRQHVTRLDKVVVTAAHF